MAVCKSRYYRSPNPQELSCLAYLCLNFAGYFFGLAFGLQIGIIGDSPAISISLSFHNSNRVPPGCLLEILFCLPDLSTPETSHVSCSSTSYFFSSTFKMLFTDLTPLISLFFPIIRCSVSLL